MLITLYLIASNVHNAVNAPDARGFSLLEVWMLGVHIPILVAIFEYFVLLVMKRGKSSSIDDVKLFKKNQSKTVPFEYLSNLVDKWTFYGSLSFIVLFNLIYWTIARFLS